MDGAGEYACTTLSYVKNNKIENIKKFNLPHSLGHFYSSITGFLGFKMLEDGFCVLLDPPYPPPCFLLVKPLIPLVLPNNTLPC